MSHGLYFSGSSVTFSAVGNTIVLHRASNMDTPSHSGRSAGSLQLTCAHAREIRAFISLRGGGQTCQ